MLLGQAGYRGTAVPDDADVLIVNTCGFLAAAEEESLATLRELAESKRPGQTLIAAGCMAQRAGERIVREVPGVDGLLGTRRWMEIVPFVQGLRGGRGQRLFGRYALLGDPEQPSLNPTPRPPVSGRQRVSEDQRRLQRPVRFLLHPHVQGQAAQSSPGCHRGRGAGAGRRGRARADPDRPGHHRLRPRSGRARRPAGADAGDPGCGPATSAGCG